MDKTVDDRMDVMKPDPETTKRNNRRMTHAANTFESNQNRYLYLHFPKQFLFRFSLLQNKPDLHEDMVSIKLWPTYYQQQVPQYQYCVF